MLYAYDLVFYSMLIASFCFCFSFIIFSLLLPYVHSEGSLGHQARDALLLCMSLSQKNSNVGTYIAKYSSMCPVLITGLGGLYSSLPNHFDIGQSDWYRITPDDVADIPKLTLFMNCLEFCNAVVQVAHDLIKQQLLDFMYQGFIVPILGPALLQVTKKKQQQHIRTDNWFVCLQHNISVWWLNITLQIVTKLFLNRCKHCSFNHSARSSICIHSIIWHGFLCVWVFCF